MSGVFRLASVGIGLTAVALLGGCPGAGGGLPDDFTGQYAAVEAQEARALIDRENGNGDFVILDVRTPEEFAAGHIAGAINICLTCSPPPFEEAIAALDKNDTYLVYCRSANRSATAVSIMARQGFTDIYELQDGLVDWQAAGLPVE
ncbi:MAG: rhodanese-like domain-containing protein [Planctomycetota bacterium]